MPTTDIVADFFRGNKAPVTPTLWIRPGLQKLTRQFGPGSTANICNSQDDRMDRIMAELSTLAPDDPKDVALWKDAQQIAVEQALTIYAVFQPLLVTYSSDRLGGVERIAGTSANTPGIELRGVFVKK